MLGFKCRPYCDNLSKLDQVVFSVSSSHSPYPTLPRFPTSHFRAALIAIATGVDRSQDGAASGAMQGHAGEFLRWLHGCTTVSDSETRHLAEAVLGHSSVQALAYL